jgi:dephospho-CoA kinase
MYVLGTCAYFGSGQDTFASELSRRLNVRVHGLGDVIRDMAKSRRMVPTRENLQLIRRELNDQGRSETLPLQLVEGIKAEGKNALITGIRTVSEVAIFRSAFEFQLAFVYADEQKRFERVMARRDAKDPNDIAGFREQVKAESELFEIPLLESTADRIVSCGMPLEEFLSGFETILQSWGFVEQMRLTAGDRA